jgi:hypothetical protein
MQMNQRICMYAAAVMFCGAHYAGQSCKAAEELPVEKNSAVVITKPDKEVTTITPVAQPVVCFTSSAKGRVFLAYKIEPKNSTKDTEKEVRRIELPEPHKEGGAPQGSSKFAWDMTMLKLVEGDKITYWLEADSSNETAQEAKKEKSTERHYTVVSKEEKAKELQGEINLLFESLKSHKDQEALKKKVQILIEDLQKELEKNK